jgi:hypothetical protein
MKVLDRPHVALGQDVDLSKIQILVLKKAIFAVLLRKNSTTQYIAACNTFFVQHLLCLLSDLVSLKNRLSYKSKSYKVSLSDAQAT